VLIAALVTGLMPQHDSGAFEPLELWRNAREPTFWLDSELRLAWVNQAWEALTGHRSKAVVGQVCHAHAPTRGDDLADLAASLHPPPESLAGEPCGTKTLIFSAGGERIWRRVEFWPFRDQKLALIGLLGVIREENDRPGANDTQANRLHVELIEVRRQLYRSAGFDSLLGLGPAHARLLAQVRLAALATTPVLIVGEPGTGKRHVARAIHQNGPRKNQALLPLDPEALPVEVLERELFAAEHDPESPAHDASHAADAGRPRLKLGDGSSLLIREIFMLPRDLQARLAASLDSSIRLIGTSVLDPEIALGSERARPDLYYAVTALVIRLRPLRERRDELPILAQHFLERANQRGGTQRSGFSPPALEALLEYDWPGNLTELARVIDHAHARGGPGQSALEALDLPASIRGSLGAAYLPPRLPTTLKPLDQTLADVELQSIERALRYARGNKSRAADLLGISRPRLYRRIKELNLPDEPDAHDEPPAES
jgi:DNA-binding NtrC family response regulator